MKNFISNTLGKLDKFIIGLSLSQKLILTVFTVIFIGMITFLFTKEFYFSRSISRHYTDIVISWFIGLSAILLVSYKLWDNKK